MTLRLNPHALSRLVVGLTTLLVSASWTTDRTADLILGRWLFPARQSTVEVYRDGNRYFGRITDVGEAYKDRIPDNKMLFVDLVYNGKEWNGGKLIHPSTGTRYDVALQLNSPQTLNVTVYKGFRCFQKNYQLVRK